MITDFYEFLGDDEDSKALLVEALSTFRNLSQLDEPGWNQLGYGLSSDLIAQEIDRQYQNQLARRYYHQDPLASQAVMLHNAFTFARGVSVNAKDKRIQELIDTFWKNPRNQNSLTRAAAQWRMNTERQLAGELFFALYVSTLTGRVTVRLFDPNEFPVSNGVITMPGDPTFPVYFRREFTPIEFDFEEGKYKTGNRLMAYYPDYRNAGADIENGHGRWIRWPANTEIYVMHMCTNPLGGRGLTHLNAGIPWIKASKGFMEDRATLTLALATFALIAKVKGNRQAVQRLVDKFGEYETERRYGIPGDSRERRQGANTLIGNEAFQLEQFKVDSGASNAYLDSRMFTRMALLGSGHIFEHYGGDPSTGNLATATAMEAPMLKMFEFEQQVWEDAIGDILNFVVLQGLRYGETKIKGLANLSVDMSGGSPLWEVEPLGDVDLTVTATMPPIVVSDVAVHAAALASIGQTESMLGQQILPPENKAKIALNMFGADDIGAIIDDLKSSKFEISNLPAPAEPQSPSEQPQAPQTAAEAQFLSMALKKFREVAIGEPLPSDDAKQVDPIRRSEVNDFFDWFLNAPDLETLLDEMGLELSDVDD